jgi:hypothetical protein
MSDGKWVRGAFGRDGARGATVRTRRTVLAAAHHVAAAKRLADVIPVVEGDQRIQVVYTAVPASRLAQGTDEFLRGHGGLVIPWDQAVAEEFDLAVVAGNGMLDQVRAPVLALPHGAGENKLVYRWPGYGPAVSRPTTGIRPETITLGGRVVPASIGLPVDYLREELLRGCPEARPVTFVSGDPCFDRLMVSRSRCAEYRQALDVPADTLLVVMSSTWGEHSLFGQRPDALQRLASCLPADRFRIAAVLHPLTWAMHGRRQIYTWLAECLERGVILVQPEEGWRGAVVACDVVLGDHGSVACYCAALHIPVILGAWPEDEVAAASPAAWLGAIAPRVRWNRPLRDQLDEAAYAYTSTQFDAIRQRLTSKPGAAARILRREMYRLLRLSEPPYPPCVPAVPQPAVVRGSEFEVAGR